MNIPKLQYYSDSLIHEPKLIFCPFRKSPPSPLINGLDCLRSGPPVAHSGYSLELRQCLGLDMGLTKSS